MAENEPEREGWANAIENEWGVCEWEYKDGKLHFYLDSDNLPFEIVAQ